MIATKKPRRLKIAGAMTFLVLSAVFAIRGMLPKPAERYAVTDETPPEDPLATNAAPPSVDLLALFGHYDPRGSVANPFEWVEVREALPLAPPPAPGPAAPPASPPGGTATPEDPAPGPELAARHLVSLVLIVETTSRAVVDGRVVGVGDPLGKGTIARITPGGIVVADALGQRFYALGIEDGVEVSTAGAANRTGDK
jgi:hypothetical protein